MVPSDIGTDNHKVVPAQIVPAEKAKQLVDKFWINVLIVGFQRAITGKGDSWLGPVNIGPEAEATHVVPQCHWNTYLIDEDQRISSALCCLDDMPSRHAFPHCRPF